MKNEKRLTSGELASKLILKSSKKSVVQYLGVSTNIVTHKFVGTLRLIESDNPRHEKYRLISGDFRYGTGIEYDVYACKRAMLVVGLNPNHHQSDLKRKAERNAT